MEAYRIGRAPTGVWVNRVPPIRRGNTFGQNVSADGVAIVHYLDSNDTSERNCSSQTSSGKKSTASLAAALTASSPTDLVPFVPPAHYIDKEVQQAVNQDVQNYPSLHPDIQHDIECKYRALHQKVINEGLYNRQYGNYAIELFRYICLFVGFMTTLHLGWYTISAILLGLFWVRCVEHVFLFETLLMNTLNIASNHVHGA